MPLTNGTQAYIDHQMANDPEFAAAVEAELQAMRIEQTLVALREQRGLSQRQLAARLGVKQPVIAKIEAGKSPNIGLRTLLRTVHALGARVQLHITATPATAARRSRGAKSTSDLPSRRRLTSRARTKRTRRHP